MYYTLRTVLAALKNSYKKNMQRISNIPQQQVYEQATPCHSRLFMIVSFLCFIALLGSVFWYVRATNEKMQLAEKSIVEKDQLLSQLQTQYETLSTEQNSLTQKYDELGKQTCGGEWSVEAGCVQQQALLAPLGGESFCLGTTTAIAWDTNILKEGTVDILLGNDGTFLKLGNTEASEGTFDWKVKDTYTITTSAGASETVTIVPGSMYTVSLKPSDEKVLGGTSTAFNISDCTTTN